MKSMTLPTGLQQQYQADPRALVAQELMRAGTSTAPVATPLQGLARALQGAVAGYQQGQIRDEYRQRGDAYRATMADALAKGAGRDGQPGDVAAMVAALAGNPDTADAGTGLQMEMLKQQMKPKEPVKLGAGDILLDPTTNQPLYTAPQAEMTPYQREYLDIQRDKNNLASGSQKPPAGYRYAADGQALEAIPGGPAEKLTPEQAAKTAQVNNARNALPEIERVMVDQAPDLFAFYAGAGETGRGRRLVKEAIEGYLRATSGAAVTESEMDRALDLYEPKPYDSAETRKAKFQRLSQFLQGTGENMMRGRTQAPATGGWSIEEVP